MRGGQNKGQVESRVKMRIIQIEGSRVGEGRGDQKGGRMRL